MDSAVLYDIQQRIDESPMSRSQWGTVAVAFGISLVDGYDVLSVTFASPLIQQEWGLDPAQLGVFLASGLFGMALGSFLLAPLADIFGRRSLILFALCLSTLGMMLAASSTNLTAFAAYRVMTGLGVGTIMAVMSSVAAEATNKRWRAFAISLLVIGFPAGGMLAGLTATMMFEPFGWRTEFWVGAVLTATMIPAVIFFMPEPLQSLLARDVPNRSQRVNAMLVQLGQSTVQSLPPPPTVKRSYSGVFGKGQRITTLWVTVFQVFLMQCVLFVLSWLPQIVADSEVSVTASSVAGTAASAMGIIGGLAFGALTTTSNVTRMTMFSVLGLAVVTASLGLVPALPTAFITIAAMSGVFAFASQAGFYTILPSCFEPEARATGIGFVLGVARMAGAASPLIAGTLFAAGWDRGLVCSLFATLALLAAMLFIVQPAGAKRT